MEKKFKDQYKEQSENSQRIHAELNEKVKTLEKENRQLQNRLQLEQRDKMSDHGAMEKRVQELIDNENKMQGEIDQLKADRDRMLVEHQKHQEKERESYKSKIADIE